jgi:HNH endonuclease
VKNTDHALLTAQGGRCFYCEERFRPTEWTRDHVRPKSAGFEAPFNIVLACDSCNSKKGARLPTKEELERLASLYDYATMLGRKMFGSGFCWGAPEPRFFSTGPEKPSTPMADALRPLAQE